MEKYTYLLVNVCSIVVPFIASFHPKLKFHHTWRAYWPACTTVASLFILWDMLYTHLGVWGFNPRYLLGIYIANLPLEEVLFFICIPYASVFSYHCFKVLVGNDILGKYVHIITYSIVAIITITGLLYIPHLYTTVTFLLCAVVLLLLRQQSWLSRFYFAYLILLIPFLIVNGILTGTGLDEPVVWYNPKHHIGFRVGTIPIEDTIYGLLLLVLNVFIYEYLHKKSQQLNIVGL